MKKLSLIAALTLSTMLSACGGGGGHGGYIPPSTLPDRPQTEQDPCAINPETCMATAKISAEEYLSQQVDNADAQTASMFKSKARKISLFSNDVEPLSNQNKVEASYGLMKELLVDAVSTDNDGNITVDTTGNIADLRKSLILAGYHADELPNDSELKDWVDTNALTIKRKAEQVYDMYFDKNGKVKQIGLENAKLTMVNIDAKQDSYVNFVVDKNGKITGLHFDVSTDSADSRDINFNKSNDGEFKRNGLNLGYKLEMDGGELYLEAFEKLNLGQLKKRFMAKLAEEGYDNEDAWKTAINNLDANDLKDGGNSDKGFSIAGLKEGNRDSSIGYTSKGKDIDGQGTNLMYSDFGTVKVNSWEGEDKIDETFVFAGGYEAKRINPNLFADQTMEFDGKAVAALIYQYNNTNNECVGDRCEKSDNYDGTAHLTFNKGKETLTANFDKWYDVTVETNNKGDNYNLSFSDEGKNIKDEFKYSDDVVKNGVKDFVGNHQMSGSYDYYGAVDFGYYGDNGIPSEATGYIAYGKEHNGEGLHSQIGFGALRK